MPSAAGEWTLPCFPFSGMGCSGVPRPRRPGGATWSSRRTDRRASTSVGRKRTRRRRAPSLYIGQAAALALQAILPEGAAVVNPAATVFGLSASPDRPENRRRGKGRGPGEGFTGHSGRVGMAQDLAARGWNCPS